MAEIETIVVTGWTDLMDVLYRDSWNPGLRRFRSPYVFRGNADARNDLSTSLMRALRGFSDPHRLEGHLLRNFRKYAHMDAQLGSSIWNWLALAQHHGVQTRLLDWSFSPLVAAHFVTDNLSAYDVDGVIWCINLREANQRLPGPLRDLARREGVDVFTGEMLDQVADSLEKLRQLSADDFVLFLEPPSLDKRIVSQFALFALMSNPATGFDEWLNKHSELARKVVIPAGLKWEVRDKLDQSGVNERMLYPGLDGLGRWLSRYYRARPPE